MIALLPTWHRIRQCINMQPAYWPDAAVYDHVQRLAHVRRLTKSVGRMREALGCHVQVYANITECQVDGDVFDALGTQFARYRFACNSTTAAATNAD